MLSCWSVLGSSMRSAQWQTTNPNSYNLTSIQSYFDQAIVIADLLKIRLTSKSMDSKRYPMCGFPIAQMDKFLEKLVREHNRFVAICEETKHYDKSGIAKYITRKVVRVVTPGPSHSFLLIHSSHI